MNDHGFPPISILPKDGRFGSGPSLVRPAQIQALAAASEWGTSHRQPPVIDRINSIRHGLTKLFSLPPGYEIAIGNGGATAFWAVAANSLVIQRAHLATFGEFGKKFAKDADSAPWITATTVEAPAGQLALVDSIPPKTESATLPDVYCYPQNETSTGVVSPLYSAPDTDALTLVDATSIAGASIVDFNLIDAYYFSPQKCFGADGGLWLAVLSPQAQERAATLEQYDDRPQYEFLNLHHALQASTKGQTVNTPAIGSLLLLDEQIKWMLKNGGIEAMASRAQTNSFLVQDWAQNRPYANLFVENPAWRSPVITTIDLDPEIHVDQLASTLRQVGIVDVEGYRGLKRNQLRIATFPSIETENVQALLACLDWAIG